MTIKWNHVPGHRGIPRNEEAHKLAVKRATSQTVDHIKSINNHLNKDETSNLQSLYQRGQINTITKMLKWSRYN